MRLSLGLLVLVIGLAVPVVAFGEGSPSPAAVAACQAEAKAIGNDAFVAKYGPTEPWGHCYAAHATAAPPATTTTATQDDPATAACKAEYAALGQAAFVAKYGASEAFGKCVALHRAPQPPTTTTGDHHDSPPATTTTTSGDDHRSPTAAAVAACQALAKALGKTAFAEKFGGHEGMGNCVKAALAKPGKRK